MTHPSNKTTLALSGSRLPALTTGSCRCCNTGFFALCLRAFVCLLTSTFTKIWGLHFSPAYQRTNRAFPLKFSRCGERPNSEAWTTLVQTDEWQKSPETLAESNWVSADEPQRSSRYDEPCLTLFGYLNRDFMSFPLVLGTIPRHNYNNGHPLPMWLTPSPLVAEVTRISLSS
jgi:hypothetical protein